MNVVYAKSNAVIPMPDGATVSVRMGSHWPIDDPVVQQQPTVFSDDPRYGLHYTAPFEEATAAPGEKRDTKPVPTPPGARRG